VIEYVDNSNALLNQLNHLLLPDGYILIGTPNLANNDLPCPDVSGYYNSIHAPYHLHLYTTKSFESLSCRQERKAVNFLTDFITPLS
jgi:2-polyprenyl-3-methyl-5-hydroxy-6-metoxy-1,4-benzoquinol methylase